MADISELLAQSDPDELQKLLGLRNKLQSMPPQTQDVQSMEEASGMLPAAPLEVPYASPLHQAKAMLDASMPKSQVQSPAPQASAPGGSDSQPPASAPSTSSDLMSLLGMSPQLLSAIQNRNQNQNAAGMGKAAAMFGSALSRGSDKPNMEVFDDISKNAGQGITDITTQSALSSQALTQRDLLLKLQAEQRKSDPNSDISRVSRQIFKMETGMDAPAGMTALDIEKKDPSLARMATAKMAQLSRQAAMDQAKVYKDAMLGVRKDSLELRSNAGANRELDKNTTSYTTLMDGSRKALGILDKIDSGDLISTKNLRHAISGDLSKLLQNSTQSAVYDRAGAEIDTVTGTLGDLIGKYGNSPVNTIPKKYLVQLRRELVELKNKVGQGYAAKTNELMTRANDAKQRSTYKDAYTSQMKANGYADPDVVLKSMETGGSDEAGLIPLDKESSVQQLSNKVYDQDVTDYAKSHGISNQEALNVKMSRTQ